MSHWMYSLDFSGFWPEDEISNQVVCDTARKVIEAIQNSSVYQTGPRGIRRRLNDFIGEFDLWTTPEGDCNMVAEFDFVYEDLCNYADSERILIKTQKGVGHAMGVTHARAVKHLHESAR